MIQGKLSDSSVLLLRLFCHAGQMLGLVLLTTTCFIASMADKGIADQLAHGARHSTGVFVILAFPTSDGEGLHQCVKPALPRLDMTTLLMEMD